MAYPPGYRAGSNPWEAPEPKPKPDDKATLRQLEAAKAAIGVAKLKLSQIPLEARTGWIEDAIALVAEAATGVGAAIAEIEGRLA